MTAYTMFDLITKSWDRPIREAKGYNIIPTEEGYQIILNTLGIKPGDISVKASKDVLTIEGKTANEEIHFTNSVNYKFNIGNLNNDIKEVSYTVADGLTIVDLIVDTEPEKVIKITKK